MTSAHTHTHPPTHLAQPRWCVTGFQSSVPCIRPDQSFSMMSWLETQAKSKGERRLRMPQGLTSVSRSSISSMSCPSSWSACLTASRLSSVRFSTAVRHRRKPQHDGVLPQVSGRFSTAVRHRRMLQHDALLHGLTGRSERQTGAVSAGSQPLGCHQSGSRLQSGATETVVGQGHHSLNIDSRADKINT